MKKVTMDRLIYAISILFIITGVILSKQSLSDFFYNLILLFIFLFLFNIGLWSIMRIITNHKLRKINSQNDLTH